MARLGIIARLMPIVTACYDTQPISRSFFFELACFSLGQMVRGSAWTLGRPSPGGPGRLRSSPESHPCQSQGSSPGYLDPEWRLSGYRQGLRSPAPRGPNLRLRAARQILSACAPPVLARGWGHTERVPLHIRVGIFLSNLEQFLVPDPGLGFQRIGG
jgi:hypothetical protein